MNYKYVMLLLVISMPLFANDILVFGKSTRKAHVEITPQIVSEVKWLKRQ